MKRLILILLLLCGCVKTDNSNIGHEYVGALYLSDPLGEEMSPDTDPLIRTDAFDCVTFVETALAGGNVSKLTKIRYKDGNVGFVNRNHFIETDWLNNNADLFEIVSAEYGPTSVRAVDIDRRGWMHTVHGIDIDEPVVRTNIEYIPYKYVRNIQNRDTLIVLFITGKSEKSDKIGTDLAVVHMGFLLPNGILRHASSQYGRVMDVDFYEYVVTRAKNKNNIGITLVKIK